MKTLTPREKRWLVYGGGAGILLLLLLVFGLQPFLTSTHELKATIAARREQLGQVQQLAARIRAEKGRLSRSERQLARAGNFSLFQFVEATAARHATKEQLVYIRPRPESTKENLKLTTLDIKLQRVDLGQTIRILEALRKAQMPVKIDALTVKTRFDDATLLDVDVTLIGVSPGGGA